MNRSPGGPARGARGARWLLAIALAPVASGCGSTATPTAAPSPGIPVRILSDAGPTVQGPFVVAVTMSDLNALLAAANASPCPAAGCFPSPLAPPEPSLLLAVPVNVPCNQTTSIEARMTVPGGAEPGELTLTAYSRPKPCQTDPASPLPPTLASLLAIPLSALPASELVLHLKHDGASPRELGPLGSYGESVVDLRRPYAAGRPPGAVTAEAAMGIAGARSDVQAKIRALPNGAGAAQTIDLVMLGTTRWQEANLDCVGAAPAPPHGTAFDGYVIMLIGGNHLYEYHSRRGVSRYCGSREIPGRHLDGVDGPVGGGAGGGAGDGMPGM